MKNRITERQKGLLSIIYEYIKDIGYPPTFEEMRENLGVSSNQSVIDLLYKLEKGGLIKKSEGSARGLSLLPAAYKVLGEPPLAPFLGFTSAGAPMEAVEISGEWQPIADNAVQLKGEVFLLKISGDSMINAGINDGDIVFVKSQKEFIPGDIVLAYHEGGATVKRFISEDKPPYIYLKPENPQYPIIPFTNETELKGRVISILKNGYWKPVE